MKFFRFIIVFALIVGAPFFSRADEGDWDGIAAVVGDKIITRSEVIEAAIPARNALLRQYAAQPDVFQEKYAAALSDALEVLIDRALILHNYETGGYNQLPDSYIDQMVQANIRRDFDNNRVAFIKTLQSEGITLEEYRKHVKDQFIESQLRLQNIQKEIVVSPYKVEEYYKAHLDDFKVDDQVKLNMIILAKTSPDDTNTLELAREIVSQIKAGAKFSDMANTYSQDAQQHPGGERGWIDKSVLRKELAQAAFALSPGQISAPIDTPDSVYILQVEEKKPEHFKPLADVRDQIEKTVAIQERARLEKQWVDGLMKKTFVRRFIAQN